MIAADAVRAARGVRLGLLSIAVTGTIQIWHMMLIVAAATAPGARSSARRSMRSCPISFPSRTAAGELARPVRASGGLSACSARRSAGGSSRLRWERRPRLLRRRGDVRGVDRLPRCRGAHPVPLDDEPTSVDGTRSARDSGTSARVWLWGTFLAATLAYLIFWGPAEVLLPYIVKKEMGGSAGELGLVFAFGGVGAMFAAIVMGEPRPPAAEHDVHVRGLDASRR